MTRPRRARPDRSKSNNNAVAVIAALVMLAGCAGSSTSSEDVFAGFDALRSDIREWNRTAAPFVSAYLDENVSADEFVKIGNPIVEDLESVVASMRGRDLTAMPKTLQSATKDIIVTYDDKLSALNQLLVAVQVGDPDAEQAAQTRLDRANASAAESACAMVKEISRIDPEGAAEATADLDALNC